ncbi:MAG: hypothetical protein Q9M82_01175 [Mariprofundus sp.]|nr:hypothetical protein [Mariprofundus sp.]
MLREGRREGKKIIKRTVANLSKWPADVVAGLKILLKGGVVLEHNDSRVTTTRTLRHGHVAAVLGTLRKTGLDNVMLAPATTLDPRVIWPDLAIKRIASWVFLRSYMG